MDSNIFYEYFSSKMNILEQSCKQINNTLWYQTKNNEGTDDSDDDDDDKCYYIPEIFIYINIYNKILSLFHICYLICFSNKPCKVGTIIITIM